MEQSDLVSINVLFFAKSRELAGLRETVLSLRSKITSNNLLNSLIESFPGLSALRENLVLSLNEEYLEINDQMVEIKTGDELAVIPPISGG